MDLSGTPTFGYEKLEGKKKNTKDRMEKKYGRKFAASCLHLKLNVVE